MRSIERARDTTLRLLSRNKLHFEASAVALLRLGCCSKTLTPVVATESSHFAFSFANAEPTQCELIRPPNWRVHETASGGRPKASRSVRRARISRATGGSPPISPSGGLGRARDSGSRPTPPPPEIPREQSHRATRHPVHARARVLTATDSGLTLKVWHRPLSPAVRAATHAAPRRRAAAGSGSLSTRRFSPHPMEERSGQGQWPPPKKPERLSLSKFSFTFLPPPKRQGRADLPSPPIKSQ